MSNLRSLTHPPNWQQQAYQHLIKGNYTQATQLYEQAIKAEPDIKSHYWNLGLMLLLSGQEAEAQTTWFLAIAAGEPEQVDLWTAELLQVLQTEAERREKIADYSVAWAIRQHIREIDPSDINNLLHIICLSINLETFTGEDFKSLGVMEILQSEREVKVDSDLLLKVLKNTLNYAPIYPLTLLEFVKVCLSHVDDAHAFTYTIINAAIDLAYFAKQPGAAARLAEICLSLDVNRLEVMMSLASFYQNATLYDKGIETAKLCCSEAQTLPAKVYTSHILLRSLMNAGGYWEEAISVFHQHEYLLSELIQEKPLNISQGYTLGLFCSTFFLPYFKDEAKSNRLIHNQVAQICQDNLEIYASEQSVRYREKYLRGKRINISSKPLKIGYLSGSLGRHSVGWLARWIFQYYDRERFQVYTYGITNEIIKNDLEEWYTHQVFKAHKLGKNSLKIAEQIYQDEIDILVDFDSRTTDVNCEVMGLKPAPVQVTWLGWDASGVPSIDYFIADPYVLPDSAQDYYTEKIWRLPQTYIAVDGFEVGVPTLRRDQLDIPSNAVVYLSAQRGYKRHADTVRLQMKILKEVSNSYFLVKGLADQESLQRFFQQIAEEEGVDGNRLRFLPMVPSEEIHRANLGVADVVLDTYPYNGATTTLETLWMCIPIVTRVGEQFAARNSYTMMMNVGVTEGIAWTDEEYVEWGIRLGKDSELRQQISWKLRQSKHTSPLWNGKQFTREMEKAYEQMWAKYVGENNS